MDLLGGGLDSLLGGGLDAPGAGGPAGAGGGDLFSAGGGSSTAAGLGEIFGVGAVTAASYVPPQEVSTAPIHILGRFRKTNVQLFT